MLHNTKFLKEIISQVIKLMVWVFYRLITLGENEKEKVMMGGRVLNVLRFEPNWC